MVEYEQPIFSWVYSIFGYFPAGIYLLKVNDRNSRTSCEICSKLTIKIPERTLNIFYTLF